MIKKVLFLPYKIVNGKPLFLIGKRPRTGIWQPPTGHVEKKDKTLPDTVLRELKEEFGIEHFSNFIDLKKFFNFKIGNKTVEEHVFAVDITGQKITLEKQEFVSSKFIDVGSTEILHFDNHKKYMKLSQKMIEKRSYPKIVIICGPSGSGKDTMVNKLLKVKSLKLLKIETVTTRERRDKDDGKIHVTFKEFKRMDEAGLLIEKNFFNNNWYATPRAPIEEAIKQGHDIVIEIDLNGVRALKKAFQGVIAIFLKVNLANLRKRLLKRGANSPENIAKRINVARVEMQNSRFCDYVVKNPEGELDKTINEVIKIVKGAL